MVSGFKGTRIDAGLKAPGLVGNRLTLSPYVLGE